MSSTAIIARHLTKRFGDLVAVDDVDLQVEAGECFGILGPNGAGKTTTGRMIHAVTPITAGDLVVLGRRVDREPAAVKRRIGVVPQEENLDPDLTALENLLVFARYFDIPRAEARRRATDLLEFVGLAARAGSPLDELSGGMKRRLLIARALLNQPELLILDGESLRWEQAEDTLYLYCSDGRALLPALSALRPPHLLHRPAGLEDLFLKLAGRSLQE